ncbi:MAG: YhcH/YjgK/YiaL family protein [Candidatus Anaerobiospirillum pullicola]|uniref:YhcH/YjgK/YiaL family protein n=1 Tax=Candidatus Anaerobiospirillum pullicola TaxID=2838451 RepID=A0A948WYX8_9GAMM|nr:YhcH/YjgK/YiaL family protein [Candidatus Anaerobiospirillum pullicola]
MLATSLELATKYDYLADKFRQSFKWLQEHDATKLENGRYDICDGAFALVQRYSTVPFDQIAFEAHNDYFDIQYLAQGIETFNVCLRKDCEVTREDPASDMVYLSTPESYTSVTLKPGEFAIVPPEEGHQPRIMYGDKSVDVVKVVVKVSVK